MKLSLFLLSLSFIPLTARGQNLPFGTVIGGVNNESFATSHLKPNEQGIRVSVVLTRGVSGGLTGGAVGRASVSTLEIPSDTDYLELLINYVNLDPRTIRKKRIRVFRIKETGTPPFRSKEVKRKWMSYNFSAQYDKGGPFDLLQAGDIVIIENKGLLNREYFDFLADVRFLVSLPTLLLSGYVAVSLLR